jgi:crotonobetainyl-CoA:carnitine CoA-transferase CaiB-like acyl-CoA transferase
MFDDPQVLAGEMIATFSRPVVGSYRSLAKAIKFSRTPGPDAFAAPTFGQHSGEILEQG